MVGKIMNRIGQRGPDRWNRHHQHEVNPRRWQLNDQAVEAWRDFGKQKSNSARIAFLRGRFVVHLALQRVVVSRFVELASEFGD